MRRVRKFGPNAFKPKMPMAAPRMKKFSGGGSASDDPATWMNDPEYAEMVRGWRANNPHLLQPQEPGLENVYPEFILAPVAGLRNLAAGHAKRKASEITSALARRSAARSARGRPTYKIDPDELARVRNSRTISDKIKKELQNIEAYVRANSGLIPSAYLLGAAGADSERGVVVRKAPDVKKPNKTDEPKKYAKGGMVRGGGCETKGKTRGRFV